MVIQQDLEELKDCILGLCERCQFTYGSEKCTNYQLDIIDDAIMILDKQCDDIRKLFQEVKKIKHGGKV